MDTLLVIGRVKALDGDPAERLEEEGLEILRTDDAEEGLRICRAERPALAFVEVDAPEHDHFDLLTRLRETLDSDGRIVAVCNRYSEALDDYCEEMGANLALPQSEQRANFGLFVRGLISLMPPKPARTPPEFEPVG
jgi:DNA-binding response OmpR family regulator